MKTAIVLSGGGAKGAYQIGVWKALRKLNINYDIVTGTSVGALNGVMMVQKDYKTALKFWKHITYEKIFEKGFYKVNKNIYANYINEFVKKGGSNPINLEKTLNEVFDEKKFYSSPIDYGIVVYNFSKLKPELLTKNKLKKETIKDYIIASAACYPAFKMKQIKDEKYIDGGYFDNMPVNLAIDLGADKIIAVDLKALGIKRKVKNASKEIVEISPRNNVGSFLDFNESLAQKNINFGYNDTMKTFQKLRGNKFTFSLKVYDFFIKNIEKKYKDTLKLININDSKKVLDVLEMAGKIFELDENKIYFLNFYNGIEEKNKKSRRIK
jgi:NTE family protein